MENQLLFCDTEIAVSVFCSAYNHEKYIRDALDGFVQQKTNFRFEVLVHDDASTDHTAEIIREYEQMYPDIIKPYYQSENQFSKKNGAMWRIQRERARGKYCAFCEGDDYWTDPLKLQKQYDIMERNPDCSFCMHKVRILDLLDHRDDQFYPPFELEEGRIDNREFLKYILNDYTFQTSSFFMKLSDFIDIHERNDGYSEFNLNGDCRILFYVPLVGNVYYIPDEMSSYRWMAEGSWNRKHLYQVPISELILQRERKIEAYTVYDKYTNYQYHDLCLYSIINLQYQNYKDGNDYKNLLKKPYRNIYQKRYGTKKLLITSIKTYMPFFVELYRKLREGIGRLWMI